jgi:hypothetical protein
MGAPSDCAILAGRQIWWYQPGSTAVRSSPSTAMMFCGTSTHLQFHQHSLHDLVTI